MISIPVVTTTFKNYASNSDVTVIDNGSQVRFTYRHNGRVIEVESGVFSPLVASLKINLLLQASWVMVEQTEEASPFAPASEAPPAADVQDIIDMVRDHDTLSLSDLIAENPFEMMRIALAAHRHLSYDSADDLLAGVAVAAYRRAKGNGTL